MKAMARAGIISITVFALFSYPSEILPIKTNLVLCLASFAGSCTQKKISLRPNFTERSRKIIHGIFRFVIPVILFALIYSGFQFLSRFKTTYKKWNDAFQIYRVGAYQECLEDYENAWPLLKTNGDYLTNYRKALSMAGKHEKAIEVLNRAGRYFPNVIVYPAL